jgi:parallel beta-helix repeat protein
LFAASILPLVAGSIVISGEGVASASPSTEYVSPSGTGSNADTSCSTAGYSTIGAAVTAAPSGGTVIVCPGSYAESVTLPAGKPLSLRASVVHQAVVNASGFINGVLINSSHSTVQGLTVQGAIGEGILAANVTHVVIQGNAVQYNDLGAQGSAYPPCAPSGAVPGDCGEGIHLSGVAFSRVSGNLITGNTGGILISDEFGPTHDNLIADNDVENNLYDCGITIPGHNPSAVFPSGTLNPTQGGVYHNAIVNNLVEGNGVLGEGAGILLAVASPGTAVYNNLVSGNDISGNGLSGVTLPSHAPAQYLDGNVITGNQIGTNNIDGDSDAGDPSTTGILVYSAVVPVSVVINRNVISDDYFGVWMTANVGATGGKNSFFGVVQQLYVASAG